MDNKFVKKSFARLTIALAVFVFGFASLVQGAEPEDGQALISLKSTDINDMHKTIATLEDEGVHVLHVIPPRVLIARGLSAQAEQSALTISNVASVHRSAVTPFAATEGMDLTTGVAAMESLVAKLSLQHEGDIK